MKAVALVLVSVGVSIFLAAIAFFANHLIANPKVVYFVFTGIWFGAAVALVGWLMLRKVYQVQHQSGFEVKLNTGETPVLLVKERENDHG